MPRDQKLVVITGAGTGIGAALAIEAAKSDWRVVLVGRREDVLNNIAATLPGGAPPVIVAADVTSEEGRHLIARACSNAGGHVDMLINNAGVVSVGPLAEMADDELQAMVSTNVLAPMALIRELLPFLRQSKGARIVNVGSMFGDIAFPLFAAYSTTKFAIRGLSDALRRELAPEGIGVTYAAPRAVSTPAATAFNDLVEPFQMTMDLPGKVAKRIWKAGLKGKRSVYPLGMERLFVLIQRLAPALVDSGLDKQYQAYLAGEVSLSRDG